MDTLNERIKNLRKEKNLTQLQLAEMLNVTDKAVSKWEVGEANPDIVLLPKISEIFGVTLDYLLTGKKEEEKISLDDMDSEKRIHYLIKKDDAENFHKYLYDVPSYHGNKQICIYGNGPIRFGQSELPMLNIPVWKEILDENADDIFGKCCDSLLSQTKDNISIAVLMTEILDEVIKKCVDLDRDDFLRALGVRYFGIGANDNKKIVQRLTFYVPIVYEQKYERQSTFFLSAETLEYFFANAEKSPKAFNYITELELKAKMVQSHNGRIHEGRECYTCTVLYDTILLDAIKYGKYDLVRNYFNAFKAEVQNFELDRNASYIYKGTFISTEWSICARLISISRTAINELIKSGKIDLVKEMIAHNKIIADKVRNMRSSYIKSTESIYVITESEVDRLANLTRTDLKEDEKFRLEAVRNHLIVPAVLRGSRNLKMVREILDNNYYDYYEFAYESLKKKDVKELFKFFVDNNFGTLATNLMIGESRYPDILSEVWHTFSSAPGYSGYEENKLLIDAQNKTGLELEPNNGTRSNSRFTGKDNIPYKQVFIKQYGDVSKYIKVMDDNPIIKRIKELKEEIYNSVVDSIAAEKKAREEEIAREKVAKGLTKDYFDELMSKGEIELFIIKLCALQDAIFMYDYHYEGEDYSERLEAHFKELNDKAPKSRQCDDGWGYMVDDTDWERSEVIPAQERISHLRDLFYRLRVSRNNVSHPKKENVKELTKSELIECMEYVFSIDRKVEE